MYLKEIRCHGFKSFADKTNIELNSGITGIVGPNGSGKSNIVDAVRWVLGEQSVKALRGSDSMSDVVFIGSKSRNAMNIASVTLVFDNSDSYIKLPYNEVSVKRRLYKDGTNEFFINEEKVRLKDVTDLFMDSGIGRDSFNIISQGKIEEIISNKAYDRRSIFEEAAGVLKYKKRKEEALRKLEKTGVNLDRVNDIIKELENQVEPLKEQKEKAEKYIEASEELKGIEIALLASDITSINYTYQDKLGMIDKLKEEVLKLSTSNSNSEAIIEDYKLKISKLEEELLVSNKNIIDLTKEKEQTNSRKNIIIERQKYEVDNTKLHDNIVSLKESKLNIENEINRINNNNNDLMVEKNELVRKTNEQVGNSDRVKKEKSDLEFRLSGLFRNENKLNEDIRSLTNYIENSGNLPSSVKHILSNPKLRGIHNVIGNIIEPDKEYSLAISTALGYSSNFIIVDRMDDAKSAIKYLKENNQGRATFFPLDTIKPKYIDNNILSIAKSCKGFIDIASNLVKYDKLYSNIVLNQLGNIIVVDNIDNGNILASAINHMYRVITIEGDLFNPGGSVTGGKIITRNIITDKYELEKKHKELEKTISNIKEIENNINEISDKLRGIEDIIYLNKKELIEKDTIINNNMDLINNYKNKLESVNEEIKGTSNIIDNTLSNEEELIINKYYEISKKLDEALNNNEDLKKKKNNLNDALTDYEFSLRKDNSLYTSKNETLKDLEIDVNRMDVKLDNLLNTLSENYSMTYEMASSIYKLEMDEAKARTKVNGLKRIIKEIGPVNINAKEEYDKVSARYEFLIKQRDDLVSASNTLEEIIKEMDNVMLRDFTKTFKVINDNFKETFKELFKGGEAYLKLTDEGNILETGIDIVACPPGKSLKNINALSGGEKTFTAISLLFAILKSRPMPFCILDEVEAALDEANVDAFGEYITKLKERTQFLLITHKKKTMEYADYLYGVTMQESGVSKLVSVKLEEIK